MVPDIGEHFRCDIEQLFTGLQRGQNGIKLGLHVVAANRLTFALAMLVLAKVIWVTLPA